MLFTKNFEAMHYTRQLNKFKVVYARTRFKACCPSISGVKFWNNLDINLTMCKSLVVFKRNLKKYFLSEY